MNDVHAATSHPHNEERSAAMSPKERAVAISRAQRAFKALAGNPHATRKQLGTARERLNDCYRLAYAPKVWHAVTVIEDIAASLHGVPRPDEPIPREDRRWITPRGQPGQAKPLRPRHPPKQ